MCHVSVISMQAATGAKAARIPSPAVLAGKTQEEILRALESGAMVIYGNRLSEAERKAIAAFLSLNPGTSAAEAVANMCPSRNPMTAEGVADKENWNGWGVDIVNSRYQTHTPISRGQSPRAAIEMGVWRAGCEHGIRAADGDWRAAFRRIGRRARVCA